MGGAWYFLAGTDYLFSSQARPENLFTGKLRTEYFFQLQEIFDRAKKKMGGGGW